MAFPLPFFVFLDTNGDGSGDKSAIGDYSVSPVEFKYTRPEGSEGDLLINSFVVQIQSLSEILATGYGDSVGSLTNGILLFLRDNNQVMVRDFTSGMPIKSNGDWRRYGGKTSVQGYEGGDRFFTASFKAIEPTKPVFMPPNHSIGLILNDDFSGLVSQTFFIEGTY